MNPEELKQRNFEYEFIFSASRSGGPGGQNVNKVSSKVELRFNIILTNLFS
jgi:ribosome-associated protein